LDSQCLKTSTKAPIKRATPKKKKTPIKGIKGFLERIY